jgi:ferrous iron transport protein B
VVDLPGAYSLQSVSPDERVTQAVLQGRYPGEAVPDLIVCVADATNLRLHLRFVLEVRRLGRPMVLALNMMDAAARRGIRIDVAALSQRLGMPVIETIAVKRGGTRAGGGHRYAGAGPLGGGPRARRPARGSARAAGRHRGDAGPDRSP